MLSFDGARLVAIFYGAEKPYTVNTRYNLLGCKLESSYWIPVDRHINVGGKRLILRIVLLKRLSSTIILRYILLILYRYTNI